MDSIEPRIMDGKPETGESLTERKIRPTSIREYVGQKKLKETLGIFINAAKKRGEPLDHMLFYGPPGLGKTTLAHIISHEMDAQIKSTSAPAIEKPGDLAAILTNMNENDILFIDEIHRLSHVIEEILYPAMEDFHIDIIIGSGPSARTVKLEIPCFTLIGATTRAGLLTSPLRDRFGMVNRLEFYSEEELEQIVVRSASVLGMPTSENGAREIAARSRGTPRIANRLLRRVRDFAQEVGDGIIDKKISMYALERLEVDSIGLDRMDRELLLNIIEKFGGGPVGLETLAAAINEEKDTIEDIYEPFLIQKGFMERTPRGRLATPHAYKHLGIPPKKSMQQTGNW